MKNLMKINAIVLLIALTLMGCSKDDNNNIIEENNNSTSAERVISTAQSGSWRISLFSEDGRDETSDFAGYVFNFNSDGTVVATKGNTTVNGTWSVMDDSSNSSNDDDGNSTDDDDFIIFFNVPQDSDFDDLNDDWDIISVTANKMELIDISGGNGGTDLLTFVKI